MDLGTFIVLEGIDGSGTTTQARQLTEWFAARDTQVLMTCEPTTGPIGRLIREVLCGKHKVDQDTLAMLFAADRKDHVNKEIQPALDRGEIVISDRYYHSTLAYQGFMRGEDRVKFVREIHRAAEIPIPDLTIILYVPPLIGIERTDSKIAGGVVREIFENSPFQEKLAGYYRQMPHQLRDQKIVIIDGSRSIEDVHHVVVKEVKRVLALPAFSATIGSA